MTRWKLKKTMMVGAGGERGGSLRNLLHQVSPLSQLVTSCHLSAWQMLSLSNCGFCQSRILLFFHISVCASADVTSHLFIFITCLRPYKPYLFWKPYDSHNPLVPIPLTPWWQNYKYIIVEHKSKICNLCSISPLDGDKGAQWSLRWFTPTNEVNLLP